MKRLVASLLKQSLGLYLTLKKNVSDSSWAVTDRPSASIVLSEASQAGPRLNWQGSNSFPQSRDLGLFRSRSRSAEVFSLSDDL